MIIKRGNVVIHTGVHAWGTGKVLEVAAFNATIQFSDGVTRKIASSHFNILETADPATFVSTEEPLKTAVKKSSTPRVKKTKLAKPTAEAC